MEPQVIKSRGIWLRKMCGNLMKKTRCDVKATVSGHYSSQHFDVLQNWHCFFNLLFRKLNALKKFSSKKFDAFAHYVAARASRFIVFLVI